MTDDIISIYIHIYGIQLFKAFRYDPKNIKDDSKLVGDEKK